MKKQEFIVPIAGLKDKVYQFEYELEDSFFDTVNEPLVSDPQIEVNITFDKTNEPYVLDFNITGDFACECDRCATPIRVAVNSDHRLFVKFGQAAEHANETEVMYISREDHQIELDEVLFDFVYISIPMAKRCSTIADIAKCDKIVEAYLTQELSNKEKDVETSSDLRWEALKNLKK